MRRSQDFSLGGQGGKGSNRGEGVREGERERERERERGEIFLLHLIKTPV